MNCKRFLAVLLARNIEFLRDRSALAWNILFPVFAVIAFAFAFTGEGVDLYKVGVVNSAKQKIEPQIPFLQTRHIQFIDMDDQRKALTKVERHQLDMLIDVQHKQYWINSESPRGYLLERVLLGSSTPVTRTQAQDVFSKQTVSGRQIRYIDWLVPGIMAMNLMFSALFGVGYVIVRYRKNGVLKRLSATPLTAFEFLSAQVVSRLLLILTTTIIVYFGLNYFIHFSMHGSYLNLLVVFTLGAVSMISMGLLLAARIASEELAGGLLNMVSWPMMFLSGVWFSLEGLHPLFQKLALIFPLTHLLNGARAIMIDGAGLQDIVGDLTALGIMSLFFLTVGALSFRWE